MSVRKYLGKIHYRCNMCGVTENNDKYQWIGDLTHSKLNICHKCAKRETGGRSWPEKSRQLKKLKQKLKC